VQSWFGPIVLAVALQGAALAGAIVLLAPRTVANRYLALALLTASGMLVPYALGWTGRVEVPPWLAFFPLNLPLALGPALQGYVVSVTRGRPPGCPWIHFVPAAAHLAYLAALSLLPPGLQWSWKETIHDDWIKPVVEAAVLVSLGAYGVLAFRRLRAYRGWLPQARSDADRYGARWLSWVLAGLFGAVALLAPIRLYTWFVAELDAGPLILWVALFVSWLGIEGWRHAHLRYPSMDGAGPEACPEAAPEASPSRRDWAADGAAWRDRIQASGRWREPSFTVADAARTLGTNTAYLSRALNEGLNLNFNELVNGMRASEAARLIDGGDPRDLLTLAYDVGFSSKSTFNRAFARLHGCPPSAYRRRVRSEKSAASS
jgi:AraC-like DNA-binding protein